MNRGEHTATLHHGTSRIDPLPRTRVNTGETGEGLLGHAQTSTTTNIYAHVIQSADAAASAAIGSIVH